MAWGIKGTQLVSERTPSGWVRGEEPGGDWGAHGETQTSEPPNMGPSLFPHPSPHPSFSHSAHGKNPEPTRHPAKLSSLTLFWSTRPRVSLLSKGSQAKSFLQLLKPLLPRQPPGSGRVDLHPGTFSQGLQETSTPQQPHPAHRGRSVLGLPSGDSAVSENAKSEVGCSQIC